MGTHPIFESDFDCLTEMSSKVKKLVEVNKTQRNPILSLDDKGLQLLTDITNDFSKLSHITELVLAHNKLTKVTQSIGELKFLRLLNIFNNQIDEIPSNIHELSELRHLNLGMNRLSRLPNRFHEMSQLEMLDLTYNNFTEESVGTMFWEANTPLSKTLRILYLSDNDFQHIPDELHMLSRLHELHLQGNLIRLLPPSFGMLKENLVGQKKVLKLERNPFVAVVEAKRKQGMNIFFHYLNSEEYKKLYQQEIDSGNSVQPSAERRKEKAKKTCRVKA